MAVVPAMFVRLEGALVIIGGLSTVKVAIGALVALPARLVTTTV
jgi:hypothetical protein